MQMSLDNTSHKNEARGRLTVSGQTLDYRASVQRSGTEFPPPDHAETKKRRTKQDQTGWLRCSNQEAADFAVRKIRGVDVEIRLPVLDSRHQRRFGPGDRPARVESARDEGRVVGPGVQEIKGHVGFPRSRPKGIRER